MKSRSPFTPYKIVLRERRQKIALFLVVALAPVVFFNMQHDATATEQVVFDFSSSPVTIPQGSRVTDDSPEDFLLGNTRTDFLSQTGISPAGGIQLNQAYTYNTLTNPSLLGNQVLYVTREANLIYVSTNRGLSIIDTKDTFTPTDDEVVSSLDIDVINDEISHMYLEGNIIYGSASNGLIIIDTDLMAGGTEEAIVGRYNGISSVPILGSVTHTFKRENFLYVSTLQGGLYVIDTLGTLALNDDILAARYHQGAIPSFVNNVSSSFLYDTYLYISTTGGGLFVVDTAGTVQQDDDTLVTQYVPQPDVSIIWHTLLDQNILHLSTLDGLFLLDTKGTASPGDDELIAEYTTDVFPEMIVNDVRHTSRSGDNLYLSLIGGGLVVVDTKGTISQNDDAVAARYDTESTPSLFSLEATGSFLFGRMLYVETPQGLSVIETRGRYGTVGTYLSNPRLIATTPTTTLSVNASTTEDHTVQLSYRTGTPDAMWRDDLSTLDTYLGEPTGFFGEFQTVTLSDSGIRLSNPDESGPYATFSTGKPDDYYEPGSIITVRMRMQNSLPSRKAFATMSFDDSDGNFITFSATNSEWAIISLVADKPFSKIVFAPYFDTDGTWFAEDYLEIDYIQVVTPDSMGAWGSWITCASFVSCALGDLSSEVWLQYKLDLETTNPNTSPTVHHVSFNGPYQPTHVYTSETQTFSTPRRFASFTPIATIPRATSITYEYSTDGGTTFTSFTPETFGDLRLQGTSFTWRALLGTTNPVVAPAITNITLLHTEITDSTTGPAPSTSTKISETPTPLEVGRDIDSPTARDILLRDYPEYFRDPNSPQVRQTASVILIKEIVRLFRELIGQGGDG